jgi:trk system potassium uptake protein TrkA
MRAIVVGCGRLGSALARRMAEDGHDVTVLDPNPAAFQRLAHHGGVRQIAGSGTHVHVLEEAGVSGCETFAAVTSSNPVNLAAGLIARKHFHVPKVIVRVSDPERVALYEREGLLVVCPTESAARRAIELASQATGRPSESEG